MASLYKDCILLKLDSLIGFQSRFLSLKKFLRKTSIFEQASIFYRNIFNLNILSKYWSIWPQISLISWTAPMQSPRIVRVHLYFLDLSAPQVFLSLDFFSKKDFASFYDCAVLYFRKCEISACLCIKDGYKVAWGWVRGLMILNDLRGTCPRGKRHFSTNFKTRTNFHYLIYKWICDENFQSDF